MIQVNFEQKSYFKKEDFCVQNFLPKMFDVKMQRHMGLKDEIETYL